jgi:hypothetical protein
MYPIPAGWAENLIVQRNIEIRPNDLKCVNSVYG